MDRGAVLTLDALTAPLTGTAPVLQVDDDADGTVDRRITPLDPVTVVDTIPPGQHADVRVRRRAAGPARRRASPVLAGIAAWVGGCVLGLLTVAVASTISLLSTTSPTWLVFLLSYLPLWLLTALILRGTWGPAPGAQPPPAGGGR